VPKQPGCIYPGACLGNTYGHGVPQQEIYSALGFIHGRRQQLPDPELPSPQWVISALQHSPPLTRHSPAQTCTTPLHRPAVQAGDHHQTQAPGKTSGGKPPTHQRPSTNRTPSCGQTPHTKVNLALQQLANGCLTSPPQAASGHQQVNVAPPHWSTLAPPPPRP